MKPASVIKTIQLDVGLDKTDGELFYCIRQLNPEQRSWGRSELARSKVLYNLSHQDTDTIGAGSAGSLLIWSAEDRTYLEITPPPQPTEREGVNYLLALWFYRRDSWPESADRIPVEALRLTEDILSGLTSEHQEIAFSQPIGVDRLQQCCQGLAWILHSALGEPPAADKASLDPQLFAVLELAIYNWGRGWSQPMQPGNSSVQAFWRKLANWLAEDDKQLAAQTLQKVSLLEGDRYGLMEIRSLLTVCVEQMYQRRLDYQQRVLAMFLARLAPPAPKTNAAADARLPAAPTISAPAQDLFAVIPDINDHRLVARLWQEGFSAGEIVDKIGKGQLTAKTVYNLISKWRKEYPELKLRRSR